MNRNRWTVLSALAAAVLIPAFGVRADEPIVLRHKFEKEQPAIYKTETTMTQKQAFMGQKIETEIKQSDVTSRVLDKIDSEGGIHLKNENKRLKVSVKIGPIGDYTFDSQSTEREKGSVLGSALTPLYERLSGASIEVALTPRGKVTAVDGYEQLIGDVLKENALAAQFAGGGSKNASVMAYQESFDQLPEGSVKPGDTWEVPYDVELPKIGKAQGKRVYTFEAMDKVGDRATARLGVKLELSIDVDLEMNGAKITGKLSVSESAGTIQFDPEKGRTLSKKAKYTISGTLNVDVNGNVIPVETEQIQSVNSELIEKIPE